MWRIFKTKTDETVEILGVSHDTRTILVRQRPQSQRALILALCAYWKANEVPFPITEVMRYEKPQHVFYSVLWAEPDDE